MSSSNPRINFQYRTSSSGNMHLVAEVLNKEESSDDTQRIYQVETSDGKQMKVQLALDTLADIEVSDDVDKNVYEFFGSLLEDDDTTLKVLHYVHFVAPESVTDEKQREAMAFDMKAYNEAIELIHNPRFSDIFA